jgi:hypothetical protein
MKYPSAISQSAVPRVVSNANIHADPWESFLTLFRLSRVKMSNRVAVCLRSWVKVNAVSPRGARKCKLMSGRADVCDAASLRVRRSASKFCSWKVVRPHRGTLLLNYSDHAPVHRR